jgi:hypothetical protein
MTRPKPVDPPAEQSRWGNVTLAFQDVDGREVAAFTIDPGQHVNGKRYRTAGDRARSADPMMLAVPETAVTFVLDWNLAAGA